MKLIITFLCFTILYQPVFQSQKGAPQEGLRIINGVQLYTKVIGEGRPLVMIHGGPGLDHSYLLPQMGELGKYYKLIFFDVRATGKSSVDIDTNSMTLDNLIEDIEGVRRSFGIEKMNLMGHSWGGFLAMAYAMKYSDRLSSLLLINTTPATSKLKDEAERIARSRLTKADSVERSAILRSESFRKRDPTAVSSLFRISFRGSFFRRQYADSLSLVFQPNYSASAAMLRYLFNDKSFSNYDFTDKLSVIQCPTLILGGDVDQVSPDMLAETQKSIPSSQLVIFKDCGHFPYIERQQEFVETIREFLK